MKKEIKYGDIIAEVIQRKNGFFINLKTKKIYYGGYLHLDIKTLKMLESFRGLQSFEGLQTFVSQEEQLKHLIYEKMLEDGLIKENRKKEIIIKSVFCYFIYKKEKEGTGFYFKKERKENPKEKRELYKDIFDGSLWRLLDTEKYKTFINNISENNLRNEYQETLNHYYGFNETYGDTA